MKEALGLVVMLPCYDGDDTAPVYLCIYESQMRPLGQVVVILEEEEAEEFNQSIVVLEYFEI